MPKYPRYQDYVIKDGKFIGEFEEMYKDFDDPWEQTTREKWASEKAVALNLIRKLNAKKVIELGCGLGHYTNKIHNLGVDVLGVDISKTAIEKARANYPNCKFVVGDILDFSIYKEYRPDVIVMAEITWYILDKLDKFIDFFKFNLPNTYLIHLLTTYPDGVQQYGKDKFTNLHQIMSYFRMEYLEWGEISYPEMNGCKRTYFLGKWKQNKG
jgi:trans-aconitate methyltransferase